MEKLILFFKKGMTLIKKFFTHMSPKRITLLILVFFFVLMIGLSFFKKSNMNEYYDASNLMYDYDNTYLSQAFNTLLYTEVVQSYKSNDIVETDEEKAILTGDMTGFSIPKTHLIHGASVQAYETMTGIDQDVFLLTSTTPVSFTHTGSTSGLYYLAIDYQEIENSINTPQIAITINGLSPFYEAQTLVLPSKWILNSTEFSLDRYQNEIQPSSTKIKDWNHHLINDYRGMHPGLFAFELNPGDVVRLNYVNAQLLIGQAYYVKEVKIPSYAEYLSMYPNALVIQDKITVSAREMAHRNDPSIRLRPEQDPSNLYYNTQFLRLNTIFGDSWQNSGQAVTYIIEAEQAGFYHLTFKYRQYLIKDMQVFRKIKINGVVPFSSLEAYAFPYTTSFLNRTLSDANNEPLKIYLEAGTNTITLEAVNYPYRQTLETIQYVMSEIQQLSLNIKRYTSGGTDRYRDWDIEAYFPHAAPNILSWALLLEESYEKLLALSVLDQPSEIGNMKVAATRLKNIAKDVNKLPSLMVQFSDGDSSVNQILGNMMQRLMRSNLELERTIFHGDIKISKPYENIFVRTWEGTKRLVLSFVNNPYSASKRKDNEVMVWVNHPRQYIEIMQSLIDDKYDGDMRITLSQMPDQNKLVLANASGQAPDVTIGVNHWLPYDFAVRNAALDLRQFEGYEDLVKHFTKGAMIPYVFEEGVYAIPGTQNFWVTYYRKDILESIGITHIPQTWDEIIEILPLLQSYGMNYFVPLAQFSGLKPFVATLPFIYQFGGDLYSPNGMQTAINSDETLAGIKLMSDLYTLYNMPKFVASFYNHFRYGLLPIGISDLSTYILLETAAVELDGLWGMDLHPGVYNAETDEIVRYSAVGAQANMIMSSTKYPEESWNFLKWWMSTDIQSEFAFLLQSTYGQAYFWNTANVDAFKTLSMPDEYKNIVLEQWGYGIEASRIPGTYMVEREISNAWTKIVFSGMNPRQALDEAVRISNREIIYKMAEFGYTYRGEIIKEYIVPSIYNIDRWLTEVGND
ncbi:MAG: extracellular solute-binding protein [Acholeplasmataceae bacterium]|nr:extracellular solute-binding protein [Acholeplasmataceae bacterium]